MHIRYTHHARRRMAQRKVTEAQVRETLESPDEIEIGDLDELIAVRRINERELRVVYEEINSTTVVIYTVINARTRS